MPTPNAPPDDALIRFRADVAKCGYEGGTAGICVSGGPDSIALLLLANATIGPVKAATVDHRLRAESADEARFVGEICAQIGVPHEILPLGPPEAGNRSDWARRARYGALRDWAARENIELLMTAHHADDQLETMLMRLNRGSGVAGLAGVRMRQADIGRPLLGWRKHELVAVVNACAITAIDDPTNYDDAYDRPRLRKALSNIDWLDPKAASLSAAALADANDALDWVAEGLFNSHNEADSSGLTIALPPLPTELTRRIVLACIKRINDQAAPRGAALDRLIEALHDNKIVTLAGVKCSGGTKWHFTREAPRRAL